MNKKYFLSIATVFVISLIYSRFMVSACMFGFLGLAIYEIKSNPDLTIRSFLKDRSFAGLILVFLVVALSGINSELTTPWLHQTKLKLPFLVLPFAFYILKPFDSKDHFWIHLVFIAVIVASTFHVLVNFLSDYKAISLSIGKGKSIPTPIDHIHYSIMVAYAIVSSFIYGIIAKDKKARIFLIFIGLYLFGFAHFLSVRTGLALSYAGIVMVLTWFVIRQKKYILGLGVLALMVTIPFIAFKTIEPFKRKINYMYWDFAKYKQGEGKHYSDSERLMSYEIAFDLLKEAPLFGHGVGDLRPIMIRKHKEKFGDKEKYIYPHNQYLYVLATMGLIGFLIFFLGILSPLIFAEKRNIFLLMIFALMLISFLVENTVQRAVITAFYLFFILLNLGFRKDLDKPSIQSLPN